MIQTNMNQKAKITGRRFAPHVSYAVKRNEDSGKWIASVCIDEAYYETDPYKDKDGAVSELIGYLDALKEKTEEKINELNDILYGFYKTK